MQHGGYTAPCQSVVGLREKEENFGDGHYGKGLIACTHVQHTHRGKAFCTNSHSSGQMGEGTFCLWEGAQDRGIVKNLSRQVLAVNSNSTAVSAEMQGHCTLTLVSTMGGTVLPKAWLRQPTALCLPFCHLLPLQYVHSPNSLPPLPHISS